MWEESAKGPERAAMKLQENKEKLFHGGKVNKNIVFSEEICWPLTKTVLKDQE